MHIEAGLNNKYRAYEYIDRIEAGKQQMWTGLYMYVYTVEAVVLHIEVLTFVLALLLRVS